MLRAARHQVLVANRMPISRGNRQLAGWTVKDRTESEEPDEAGAGRGRTGPSSRHAERASRIEFANRAATRSFGLVEWAITPRQSVLVRNRRVAARGRRAGRPAGRGDRGAKLAADDPGRRFCPWPTSADVALRVRQTSHLWGQRSNRDPRGSSPCRQPDRQRDRRRVIGCCRRQPRS